MTQQRAVIRIQLDPQAKRLLDQLCEQRGMTQIAVLSRAVSWLTRQNNLIQTAILGGLSPEDQAELAKLLLKRMSKGSEAPDARRDQPPSTRKRRAQRDKPPAASSELSDATE